MDALVILLVDQTFLVPTQPRAVERSFPLHTGDYLESFDHCTQVISFYSVVPSASDPCFQSKYLCQGRSDPLIFIDPHLRSASSSLVHS